MRLVVATGRGQVELSYMWLPTWIGLNGALKNELEGAVRHQIEGKPLDEETLDMAHEAVMSFLEAKFPIEGLRDYLDALKFVRIA